MMSVDIILYHTKIPFVSNQIFFVPTKIPNCFLLK